jgi:hypothetical protein
LDPETSAGAPGCKGARPDPEAFGKVAIGRSPGEPKGAKVERPGPLDELRGGRWSTGRAEDMGHPSTPLVKSPDGHGLHRQPVRPDEARRHKATADTDNLGRVEPPRDCPLSASGAKTERPFTNVVVGPW